MNNSKNYYKLKDSLYLLAQWAIRAMDSGKSDTIDSAIDACENGIVSYMEGHYEDDRTSLTSAIDSEILSRYFKNIAISVSDARRKMGIENNGLCLIAALAIYSLTYDIGAESVGD